MGIEDFAATPVCPVAGLDLVGLYVEIASICTGLSRAALNLKGDEQY